MENIGLRHAIVTGSATLPVAFLIMAGMWLLGRAHSDNSLTHWLGLATAALTGYLLLELNNRETLLRIRSRMVSSTFLVTMAAMTQMQELTWDCALPLSLLLAYYMLFRTYQDFRSQGYVFHAFLFVGLAALWFPKIMVYAPFLLLAMVVQLRSLTIKSFFAAIMGAAFPLLLREAYLLCTGAPSQIYAFCGELADFGVPDFTLLNEHQIISGGVVILAALVAMTHFRRTQFNDKIRTRMFFNIIMIVELLTVALMAAQPQHFDALFRILIANSSILIAHQLCFARGIVADIYFYVLFLIIAFLGFYNFTGYNFDLWRL